jgi:DNA damage-binding protein 1
MSAIENCDELVNVNEKTNLLGAPSTKVGTRKAFEGGDVESSRFYHEIKHLDREEPHQTGGEALKSVILGGLDGILTAFAIVAGAAGGNYGTNVILVLGFSNIFADALSMGVGEFLSSKAENEWILSERAREKWEMDNYPEGEIREMIDLYIERGLSKEDAEKIILTMAKYKTVFIDFMMKEELD